MRRIALASLLAVSLTSAPTLAADPAPKPPHETPIAARMLPVAVGALAGATIGFFAIPLIFMASTVTGPATSPMLGFIGAGLGGVVGTQYMD